MYQNSMLSNVADFVVDGGYSVWGKWTPCSKSCGAGASKSRSRSCTNPPPQHGGKDCKELGESTEKMECSVMPCNCKF